MPNRNFALGVADNARLTIPFNASRLFSGQVVDTTTILVKFTHRIDLDLDGVITTNDATIFNSNYSEGAPAYWSIGDLDYDRVFTTNDATLFNSFYNEVAGQRPGARRRRRRHPRRRLVLPGTDCGAPFDPVWVWPRPVQAAVRRILWSD